MTRCAIVAVLANKMPCLDEGEIPALEHTKRCS